MNLAQPEGWTVLHLQSVGSTNSFLEQFSDECPVFAVADVQTSGRGRLGRRWESPAGGLYASYCVGWHGEEANLGWVPLLTGLSARRALARQGVDAVLKWPNDLIHGGKKLGGILAQHHGSGESSKIVVGTGINVNNEPPLESATSAKIILGREADLEKLASDYVAEIARLFKLADDGLAPLRQEYVRACATVGRPVRVETPGGPVEGVAIRFDPDGALVLDDGKGGRRVLAGDCVHLQCTGSPTC